MVIVTANLKEGSNWNVVFDRLTIDLHLKPFASSTMLNLLEAFMQSLFMRLYANDVINDVDVDKSIANMFTTRFPIEPFFRRPASSPQKFPESDAERNITPYVDDMPVGIIAPEDGFDFLFNICRVDEASRGSRLCFERHLMLFTPSSKFQVHLPVLSQFRSVFVKQGEFTS